MRWPPSPSTSLPPSPMQYLGPSPGAIAETGAAVLIVRNVEPVPASPARSGARIPCLFFVRPAPRGGQKEAGYFPFSILDSPDRTTRQRVLPGRAGTGR